MRWDGERGGYVIEDKGSEGATGLRAMGTREAWRLRRAGTQAWVERTRPEGQTGGKRKRKAVATLKVCEQKTEWRRRLRESIERARAREKRAREDENARVEEREKRKRVGGESDSDESSEQHEEDMPQEVEEEWDDTDLGGRDTVEELELMSDDEEVENAAMAVIWAEIDHG